MHKGLPSRSGACPECAFGGYSKVRVRLKQPHQSAPKSQAQSIAATIPRCSTAARGTPACLTSTIAHVNTTHPRPELDVVSVLSKNLSPVCWYLLVRPLPPTLEPPNSAAPLPWPGGASGPLGAGSRRPPPAPPPEPSSTLIYYIPPFIPEPVVDTDVYIYYATHRRIRHHCRRRHRARFDARPLRRVMRALVAIRRQTAEWCHRPNAPTKSLRCRLLHPGCRPPLWSFARRTRPDARR